MKVRTLMATMALAVCPVLLSAADTEPVVKPKPVPVPGCHHKGVAVHTYYGKAQDLERYMSDLSAAAVSSRMQIMVVETKQGAQVHLFEQTEGRNYTKSSWQGDSVANLRQEWDAKILSSRGSSCAGADLKSDLQGRGMPLSAQGAVEHVSAANTFYPLVSNEQGYMRVTLFHPCD
jgi:hypothetical protein